MRIPKMGSSPGTLAVHEKAKQVSALFEAGCDLYTISRYFESQPTTIKQMMKWYQEPVYGEKDATMQRNLMQALFATRNALIRNLPENVNEVEYARERGFAFVPQVRQFAEENAQRIVNNYLESIRNKTVHAVLNEQPADLVEMLVLDFPATTICKVLGQEEDSRHCDIIRAFSDFEEIETARQAFLDAQETALTEEVTNGTPARMAKFLFAGVKTPNAQKITAAAVSEPTGERKYQSRASLAREIVWNLYYNREMTQMEVAKETGLSRATIEYYLNDYRREHPEAELQERSDTLLRPRHVNEKGRTKRKTRRDILDDYFTSSQGEVPSYSKVANDTRLPVVFVTNYMRERGLTPPSAKLPVDIEAKEARAALYMGHRSTREIAEAENTSMHSVRASQHYTSAVLKSAQEEKRAFLEAKGQSEGYLERIYVAQTKEQEEPSGETREERDD